MANQIDSSIPQNSESPTLGAQRIREFKADVNTLVGLEHDVSDDLATQGFHGEQITGKASGALDTPPTGYGRFLWRVINGITELFHNDDAGNDTQITNNGEVKATPSGVFMPYGGDTAPDGWLLCDGTTGLSTVANPEYSDLFDVIGIKFGGTATTDFALPDMREKIAVGVLSGGTFDAIGDTGGEETHLLSHEESGVAVHKHSYTFGTGSSATQRPVGDGDGNNANYTGNTNNSTGVDAAEAHNNLQPYLVTNYIIKL